MRTAVVAGLAAVSVVLLHGAPCSAATADADEPLRGRRWSVTTDLWGAVSQRFGLQAEYALTPRDAVTGLVWAIEAENAGSHDFVEGDPDYGYRTWTHGEGLELQYRRYLTLRDGAGLFVATGLQLQGLEDETQGYCVAYTYNHSGDCPSTPRQDESFTYYGFSADFGGETVFPVGLVLSWSVGIHYRSTPDAIDESAKSAEWVAFNGPGLHARTRLAVGWAW
jgi:hypothetical protein